MTAKGVGFVGGSENPVGGWTVPVESVAFDEKGIRTSLLMLDKPCFAVREGERIGLSNEGRWEGTAHRVEGAHRHARRPEAPLPDGQRGANAQRDRRGGGTKED